MGGIRVWVRVLRVAGGKREGVELVGMANNLKGRVFVCTFCLQVGGCCPGIHVSLSSVVRCGIRCKCRVRHIFGLPRARFYVGRPLGGIVRFLFFGGVCRQGRTPGDLQTFRGGCF